MFKLALESPPEPLARKLSKYDAIPAALIGRLARHERAKGSGIGDLLVADAVSGLRVGGSLRRSSSMRRTIVGASSTRRTGSSPCRPGRTGCSCSLRRPWPRWRRQRGSREDKMIEVFTPDANPKIW
jgi:hypothetical protein